MTVESKIHSRVFNSDAEANFIYLSQSPLSLSYSLWFRFTFLFLILFMLVPAPYILSSCFLGLFFLFNYNFSPSFPSFSSFVKKRAVISNSLCLKKIIWETEKKFAAFRVRLELPSLTSLSLLSPETPFTNFSHRSDCLLPNPSMPFIYSREFIMKNTIIARERQG